MAISFPPRKNALDTKRKLIIAAELALALFLFIIPGGPIRPNVEDGPDPEEVANFHLNGWPAVDSWYVPLDFFVDEQVAGSSDDGVETSDKSAIPTIIKETEEDENQDPVNGFYSDEDPSQSIPPNDSFNGPDKDKESNEGNEENPDETTDAPAGSETIPPQIPGWNSGGNSSGPSDTETSANYTIPEDQAALISVGSESTILNITQPSHGAVVQNSDGTITYTPTPNYSGSDSFTVTTVNDGSTTTHNVTVIVIAVNDPPVASNITITTTEDFPVAVTVVNGTSDVDGDVGIVIITQPPTNGIAVVNQDSGTITYIPNPDFYGTDNFAYTISDGMYSSNGTVSITVTPANDDPVLADDALGSISTNQSVPVLIDILGSIIDPDGDALTVANVTQPSNGIAVLHPNGTVTYTPSPSFTGQDTFAFTVTDPYGGSVAGTVTITVNPLTSTSGETPLPQNNAPSGADVSATLDEDSSVTIQLQGSDLDNDTISFTIVTNPLHGIVAINGTTGVVHYTPFPDYFGPDSFTYSVIDGNITSPVAAVSIHVNGLNDVPVANDYAVYGDEGDSILVSVLAGTTDVDGDLLNVTVESFPQHGIVIVNQNGTLVYTPHPDYYGTDSFEYVVSDGSGGQAAALVTITLGSVNDTPQSSNEAVVVEEDNTVDIVLHVIDADGDALTIVIVSSPTHGDLEIIPSQELSVRYAPDQDYHGSDGFSYQVTDGQIYSNTANVSIVVSAVNDSPVAVDDEAMTTQDEEVIIQVLENDADPDGSLLIQSVGDASHGTVQIDSNGQGVSYLPDPGFTGDDSFSYAISDGEQSATAAVNVSVYSEGGDDDGDGSESDDEDVDLTRGHVTGGGWFNSTEGSYVGDSSLSGKVNFGFVAKYHKDDPIPKGQTQVQIHIEGLNFHSTGYDTLEVDGEKAHLSGNGTVDGEGEFGFAITVIDGEINGENGLDMFRIKIWDESSGAIVYDNMLGEPDGADPTVPITGGSIKIHKS